MKILHLSTFDICGGAARAAYRLHQGLKRIGIDSKMLVQKKLGDEETIIGSRSILTRVINRLTSELDKLPLRLYLHREGSGFSLQCAPNPITKKVTQLKPDIINLHWICNGYIPIESIAKLNRPLVWTLHDMWPFTGGCHYSGECNRYTEACGICPQLHSIKDKDLSHWVWKRKAKAWDGLDMTIISSSRWLAKVAGLSSLFKNRRIEVIPYSLDTENYKPSDKSRARKTLNLPEDKYILLFGAKDTTENPRKGFYLLQKALQNLSKSEWHSKIELVIFGSHRPQTQPDFCFKVHYLGCLQNDVSLATACSAADTMVVPSIQEAFGQIAFEALSCGTPVVCFDSTGLKDIVDHKENGYRAECFNCDDLANGIAWVLQDKQRWQKLSQNARNKAEKEYRLEVQARRYEALYRDMLNIARGAQK